MHITNAFKQPWPGVALCLAVGGWFTWAPLNSYFERGHWAYLIMAAGYALFTLLIGISAFVNAPVNRDRFTRGQIFAARMAPLASLAIVFIGMRLRYGW